MTSLPSRESAPITRLAIIEDAIYPHAAKHVAKCQACRWRAENRRRPVALRSAASHVEDTGHTVCVEAVDVDWLVAVPNLPKYAKRRVMRDA